MFRLQVLTQPRIAASRSDRLVQQIRGVVAPRTRKSLPLTLRKKLPPAPRSAKSSASRPWVMVRIPNFCVAVSVTRRFCTKSSRKLYKSGRPSV